MRRGSTSDPTVTEGCQACLVWIPGPAGVLDPAEKVDPISAADLNVAAAQTAAADLTLAVGLNAAADPNAQVDHGVVADPNVVAGLSVAAVLLAVAAQIVAVLPYVGEDRSAVVDRNVVAAQIDSVRSAAQIEAPPAVRIALRVQRAQNVSSVPAVLKVGLAATLLRVTNRQAAEQLMAAKFQFAPVALLSVSRHRHQVQWVGQFFLAYSHPCRSDAQQALHQKDCRVSLRAAVQDHFQTLSPVFEEY